MKVSSLKHKLEILELNHKHEVDLLKMKLQHEKEELLKNCNHTYDDGTSAKTMEGVQWNYYYKCGICGKTLK